MKEKKGQDWIDGFWRDYFNTPKGVEADWRVHQSLLDGFRVTLDKGSPTARAIDENAPADVILRTAEKEGFVEFAQILRFARFCRGIPHMKPRVQIVRI